MYLKNVIYFEKYLVYQKNAIHELEKCVKIITIMWAIWHSRNCLKHGEDERGPTTTIRLTKEALAPLHIPRMTTAVLPGFDWCTPDPVLSRSPPTGH